MSSIDKHDRLKGNPFSYKITKSNKMMIYYEGRHIMILNPKETQRLEKRMTGKSDFDIQMELAKATGNFKRVNEKQGKYDNYK